VAVFAGFVDSSLVRVVDGNLSWEEVADAVVGAVVFVDVGKVKFESKYRF
jgi:hypothetical protein